MEEQFEIYRADEFIAFLSNVERFRMKVEIALIVDNQVCDSTFQINPQTEKGKIVLDYLLRAAIGARLGLYREVRGNIAPPGVEGLNFGP
jgi:hypothetical protein